MDNVYNRRLSRISHQTLIFLHIPKTAGTTLRSILMRQYSDGKVCLIYDGDDNPFISTEEFNAFTDDKKSSYDAIMGHLTFGLHHMLPKELKYTYAAIIRDPVKRVLSLYNHFINNQFKDSGHSILDFIADRNAQFDNHQVRILSGKHAPFGKCSEMMLNAAIKNLSKKFSLVGITEMFEETLFLANKLLGWKAVPYANKNIGKNMSNPAPDVHDDSVINRIKEYNSLDIKLYEYASNLMWGKIRNTGADWEENLREFKDELAFKIQEPVVHFLREKAGTRLPANAKLKKDTTEETEQVIREDVRHANKLKIKKEDDMLNPKELNEKLRDRVSQKFDNPAVKKSAKAVVDEFIQLITDELKNSGEVRIPKLGVLKVIERPAGMKTEAGTEVKIPARKIIKLVMAKQLKEVIDPDNK